MTGVHCLVFSKGRAMQLDAFLRSASRFAPYASTTVLFLPFDESYKRCVGDHLDAVWLFDDGQGMERYVRRFLRDHERVVFHTDDDVFFDWPHPGLFEHTDEIVTLRLGRNTRWCHPLGWQPQPLPADWPSWRWRGQLLDFGYPLSLNGTVYRSEWLLPLLDFPFANPTELEAGLAARADRLEVETMRSGDRSCVVSLPHNVTSSSSGNPHGWVAGWQPDALRQAYLMGWRIDLERMDFSNVVAAHQEIALAFTPARVAHGA